MRRKGIALCSALLLGFVLLAQVAAEPTSQGLEWTVNVGDVHYFIVDYWEGGDAIHEDMYYNVSSNHAAMPDPLVDWWDIPDVPLNLYFANGTDASMLAVLFAYGWKVTVPIGNWTLMDELIENVTEFTIFDPLPTNASANVNTWLHWGFSYNATVDTYIVLTANTTYLKSDGVLASLHLLAYDTGILFGGIIILRDGHLPDLQAPDDIDYIVGETGHQIVWNATDQSPAGYMVFKDEVEIRRGFWNASSEEITVDVDGLDAGTYNYTVVFYEASGISASDTVWVDVGEPATTTTSTTTATTTTSTTTATTADGFDLNEFLRENALVIAGIAGIAVILIIVVIVKRR
ncbi:MAG: hypothetical protein EAX95_13310 [Candidatus Thorarchaeota archaeon]|nr:hypothetical protein [Candidatus Thorarchaeota archaeon]